MTKLTKLFIAIVMVMAAFATTAYAYDNSVTIFVNDKEVKGVEAFLDSNDTIWVSDSLVAARKLFPEETADLYFPDVVEDRKLQDMANAFGYKMEVDGLTVYLEKGGSNEEPNDPETDKTPVTIFMDGQKVTNVEAYLDQNGDVWLVNGYTALQHMFNIAAITPVRDLLLEPYASEYGYVLTLEGTNVYLTKQETAESFTLYVNDKMVKGVSAYLDEDGNIRLENGYSALKKLFPDETEGENFPSVVRNLLLESYANEYGYVLTLEGTNVYLTKEHSESPVKIYVNDMRINVDAEFDTDGTVVINPKDIYTIFPEASVSLESGDNYSTSLKKWADHFKYQYIQKGIRVYLVKDWQKPLEIHCQGEIIDFPDQQPFVANNRTFIPVRMVAEVLGCEVEWKGTTVEITGGGKTIVLYVNSTVYTVNGVEYSMDTPTTIVKDRTVVPIRFVAEAMGYNVEFHDEGVVNVVSIEVK